MGLMGKLWEALGIRIKNAIEIIKPNKSNRDVNSAIAQITSLGQRFDAVNRQKSVGMFVQSNTDQTMRLLAEDANEVLDSFNNNKKIDILYEVLKKRVLGTYTGDKKYELSQTMEPFITMLIMFLYLLKNCNPQNLPHLLLHHFLFLT